MEATALSVGKSVLDGALGYAKSAVAEEVALQLGVQRDHAFIRDELEMMQSFLMAAHEDGDEHKANVFMTWVKQVRDVAYDAEDCLHNFSVHLHKPSWWRLPSTLRERRRVAKQMKELRARVEDVSQRNLRYQLVRSAGSKSGTGAEHSSITAAAIFGIDDARRAARHDKPKEDLVDLINQEGEDLRVIALWGTSGDLGLTSIINMAYENPDIRKKFICRAWVRISHPFNANDFIQSIVKQFRSAVGIDILLLESEKTGKELAQEFTGYINDNSYLVVLNDLTTFEDWKGIKAYLPNHKKGSRIIVSSPQVKVASLCAGQESHALELKQLSADQTIYAFYEKIVSYKESVMRPFILKDLLKSLVMQLNTQSSEKKGAIDFMHGGRNMIETMGTEALIKELARLIEGKKCLIILDDLSSIAEWDNISGSFPKLDSSCRVLVTTREESIAKHCSEKLENIYKLSVLKYEDAKELLTRKVFKEAKDLDKHPELMEEARKILNKCNGLPLAIVTIGGFLANQPKVAVVWRKLNEHISAELEMNPELEAIKTMLGKSYDGLPYHLKSCFLYMSIFPEDHKVSRRRLIQRWSAEGYAREIRDKSPQEVAENYFMELIQRSMILPSQLSVNSRKVIDSCQVHDLMRAIGISKSEEEKLIFRMEEGRSSNNQGIVRHLVISTNWEGDKSEFESTVDLSRIRSLTVFGKWRPFLISDKMRFLRVLDLEGTSGLVNHHLEHIGKLLLLRYLSLRDCKVIFHLPDSLGNLKQLETLDIVGTMVLKLPKTITKLRKLQYLRASKGVGMNDEDASEHTFRDLPQVSRNRACIFTLCLLGLCVACCVPHLFKESPESDSEMNRHDVCTSFCGFFIPFYVTSKFPVHMPRGIGKLKALHTLGLVNLAWDKAILQDIKRLTQLRKLAVTGINKKNGQEFCSVVANLNCLESLLVQSRGYPGICDCLDGISSPPKNLQSLKLYGDLAKLPRWIEGLHTLVKLTLRSSRILEYDEAMQVLGKLQNLASLRLWAKALQGEDFCLTFHPEAFPSLTVLGLNDIDGLRSVEFEEGAMLQLERVDFSGRHGQVNAGMFSGLAALPSLREFMLDSDKYKEDFVKDVQAQLAQNPNAPVLKR
ncbi:hypothetical protein HU200_010661 [Digitaria exilis]|uniref:Disease resistance protein RPM1 n=1 Tax=Digitaria exilis TaxID=1010633 RepID=A0A835KRD5_9POAL|nr:hypothetical protein HU200_010661 [Digitaria exilis]